MTPRTFVYVSNAEDGTIGIHAMDRDSGRLTAIGTVAAGANVMPMAVAPDRRHLYASIRSQPFRVVTFAIDATTGALTQKASAPLADSMCSLAVDATGRHLLSASYGGNLVAVHPIGDDGEITGGAAGTMPTGRHAHSIVLDHTSTSAYVPCLGNDEVMQYAFDGKSGRLTALAPGSVATGAGYGPRHLRVSPDNRFVYVLCELTGHVVQFERQPNGALVFIDEVPSVPPESGLVPGVPRGPGSNATNDPVPCVWCADLAITPDGRFLFATERTTSSIACLSIDKASGALRFVDTASTEIQPRGIRLTSDGRFLVASGERSDQLAVHRIDTATGKLSLAGRYPGGRGANWVEIVDFD
jgi:6-phosphogluconolactonase